MTEPGATSAVLLRVPEADALVQPWRNAGEPPFAGVPAGVPLLVPFLPPARLDDGVLAELEWFFAGVDAFAVHFGALHRSQPQGVLYLEATGSSLRELAEALARRWPETPPYDVPDPRARTHLTVVQTSDEGLIARAETALLPHLPLSASAEQAALWVRRDDGRWSERAVFEFAPSE